MSEALYKKTAAVVTHALDTLEVKNSASHSEVKIGRDGKITIIEIGSRMGGDAIGSDLVRYSTGIDYVRAVIQVACGIEPDLTPARKTCKAESRFILTEEDLIEFKRLQSKTPDRILKMVDDRHFDLIGKTTDSSNRAGCYIVRI